jgi:secreted Zn-dependent insulinase-like peptidase
MMIQPGDEDIPDLLWRPYDHEVFDPEEIMMRLNMLSPERGIVMFISQIVEKQEKELQTEKWYGTKWCKAKIDDEFVAKLKVIRPSSSENLGYPPINKYIPK